MKKFFKPFLQPPVVIGAFILLGYFSLKAYLSTEIAIPRLISSKAIWEEAEYSSFTDLAEFHGFFFCVFRESTSHAADMDGQIRVLKSKDGNQWESVALLAKEGLDLRDPKLSITPEGKLMLNAGGSIYRDEDLKGFNPQVTFSSDGINWEPFQSLNLPGEWPWRVTWNDGIGYTASYRLTDFSDTDKPWMLTLMQTKDGIHYSSITPMDLPGHPNYPNETTLRFFKDNTMVALARVGDSGWIGTAKPPYKEWDWVEIGQEVGGPNFLVLPDGAMWAASREMVGSGEFMQIYLTVAHMTTRSYEPLLRLPSGGDSAYAGMVYRNGVIYISYYSSHADEKTKIYFARVSIE